MKLQLSLDLSKLRAWRARVYRNTPWLWIVGVLATILSLGMIAWSGWNDYIVAYGDAESHLNIAKRVIHSLTPGFAQLGGIWLPIPHIMMIPFIWLDPLWRTGIAGSIVSGFGYVVSSIFLYKLTGLLTRDKFAAFVAALVFMLNPNILYMQSTPMTELPLIMFFILSTYFFIRFLKNPDYLFSLIAAAFFGFCATLTRYDGWFLVAFQALVIVLMYIKRVVQDRKHWLHQLEGKFILFATPAFFGIFLWLMWDFLILGDALYFTNSEFSAKTQQANWLARGELPAYHNIFMSVVYYVVTALSNVGVIIFAIAIVGFVSFLATKAYKSRFLISLILLVPFIFYIFTLFVGQSVIFIPHLTPVGYEWRLFNVRYGLMAVPFAAIFYGLLFHRSTWASKIVMIVMLFLQFSLFTVGYSKVITWEDGIVGLSHAKRPNAEYWLRDHYDGGLVLIDDYARTMSLIRTGIPMQENIYVGNKPYWEISLHEPERYARWIVMQKDDAVWKAIYEKPAVQARLYKYFQKAYTSPNILIFRRMKT